MRLVKKILRRRRLQKIAAQLPGSVFEYREWPNGRCYFPYTTSAIEDLLYCSVNDLEKDASIAWKRLSQKNKKILREKMVQSVQNKTGFRTIVQVSSPQGQPHWIRANVLAPQRLRDNSTLWSGHLEDITEEYGPRELALQKATLLEFIFENLPDQICYTDADAKVLGGNRAWMCARGVERLDELIGKTNLDIHPPPLGRQLYDNEIRQIESGETTRIRERHTQPNGKIAYVESIKVPLKNELGKTICLVGISRDITRQALNEKQLILAQQESEAANQAKSAFLAMMSHEIRTPMNGVIGATSLLLGTELTQQQEEFVHTIQVSGETLMTIINDILDYSKIEAGKIELEAIPFSLRDCVENIFDLFIQSATKKNLELLYHIDPTVPVMLTGDPTRLRQILVNLIGNAVKFTEKGEVALEVLPLTIDETNRMCQLQFSVRDTGIGISEEAQEKLFQSFTQADLSSTRKYGGTGLGLAISRRLTELMGGEIWIESVQSQGSTFHFTAQLPIPENQSASAPISAKKLAGKRILIVDDNETNRNILTAQIQQWGARPWSFAHPEQVVEHLRQSMPYDLILLDHHMPKIDGVMLAKSIAEQIDLPRVPIILLSSSYEHIPAHSFIDARLPKPVKMERLQQQMLTLIDATPKKMDVSCDDPILESKSHSLRILVAEDNPINRRVLQMMLQRLGYNQVTFVENGLEALAAVGEQSYDLILMDVQMPRMNGLEATQKIRDLTDSQTQPWIIALTAGVMVDERKKMEEGGMNEILPKPLSIERLEEQLKQIEPHRL